MMRVKKFRPPKTTQIFISYSRKDIEFARKLVEQLKSREITAWIDWIGIPPSVEWWKEIEDGIEKSDVFIFLISPDSIKSEPCRKEIAHCVNNSKRIIPIVVRDPTTNVPDELAKLNWIFCRENDDFDAAFEKLIEAIYTDFEWVKAHGRLQIKALEWERRKGENSYLLRGKDLKEAESLLKASKGKDPQFTDLQYRYIQKSRQVVRRQQWLPFFVVSILALFVFFWGKYYFLILPVPRACPAVNQVLFEPEIKELSTENQKKLLGAISKSINRTSLENCKSSSAEIIKVTATPSRNTEEITLEITLPNTPAYKLDFLPEIRHLGPEIVSIAEAEALLRASSAYSLGEYEDVASLMANSTSLTGLTLLAQSHLLMGDLDKSQTNYKLAVNDSQDDSQFANMLRMGAALSYWRPLIFDPDHPEGKRLCEQAGRYYGNVKPWPGSATLVLDIENLFDFHCNHDEWITSMQNVDRSLYHTSDIGNFTLALWCSANNDGFENCDYEQLLTSSNNLLRARSLLARDYLLRKDDCEKAEAYISSYRSEIINRTDVHEMKVLLQNQAIYCP